MSTLLFCRNAGATFLELIVVVAIVAILSAIAAPSFVSMTQRTRVASESTELMGTMLYARAEAIRRGEPVSVCASSDGATCLSTSTWQGGWIVFSDPAANRTVGTILRKQGALKSSDTIAADNAASFVTFSGEGFAMSLPASVVTFTFHTTPSNNFATQCVALNKTGRLQTQATGTGSCA